MDKRELVKRWRCYLNVLIPYAGILPIPGPRIARWIREPGFLDHSIHWRVRRRMTESWCGLCQHVAYMAELNPTAIKKTTLIYWHLSRYIKIYIGNVLTQKWLMTDTSMVSLTSDDSCISARGLGKPQQWKSIVMFPNSFLMRFTVWAT